MFAIYEFKSYLDFSENNLYTLKLTVRLRFLPDYNCLLRACADAGSPEFNFVRLERWNDSMQVLTL